MFATALLIMICVPFVLVISLIKPSLFNSLFGVSFSRLKIAGILLTLFCMSTVAIAREAPPLENASSEQQSEGQVAGDSVEPGSQSVEAESIQSPEVSPSPSPDFASPSPEAALATPSPATQPSPIPSPSLVASPSPTPTQSAKPSTIPTKPPSPSPTLSPTQKPTPTQPPTTMQAVSKKAEPTAQPQTNSYDCNCAKTCPNMSSCAEAQYQLNVCGCGQRDGDNDGIACDADCQ